MQDAFEALSGLLEQFDWLADSHVHSVAFQNTLDNRVNVTLLIRATDQSGAERTLKLVLSNVFEYRLQQPTNCTIFEASSGVGIAQAYDAAFLDLSSSLAHLPSRADASGFGTVPRLRTADQIRNSDFYLAFADFTAEFS